MSESAIGLGHLVSVIPLLDGVALSGSGLFQFACKRINHPHALAFQRKGNDPAHGKRKLTGRGNLHGNLISSATHAAALYFQAGLHVVDRLVQGLKRINCIGSLAGFLDGAVDDSFGNGLLPARHDGIDQAFDNGAAVTTVKLLDFFNDSATTRHTKLFLLGSGFTTFTGGILTRLRALGAVFRT